MLLAPLARPTAGAYRRYLCDLYGFVIPFETALAFSPDLELEFVEVRIRSGRIAADLMALGISGAEIALLARRFEAPRFASAAEALAWLYVVERLTSHHELLRQRLALHIPCELAKASTYFATCQAESASSWVELGAMLNRWAYSEGSRARLVTAATEASRRIHGWLTSSNQCSDGEPIQAWSA